MFLTAKGFCMEMSHSRSETLSLNMTIGILAVNLAETLSIPAASRSFASFPIAAGGSESSAFVGNDMHMSKSEFCDPNPLAELPKTRILVPGGKASQLTTTCSSLFLTASLASKKSGEGASILKASPAEFESPSMTSWLRWFPGGFLGKNPSDSI